MLCDPTVTVIVVTPHFPDPSNYEGTNRCIYQFIDLLCGLGHTVHMIPLNPKSATGQRLSNAEELLRTRNITLHKQMSSFEYSDLFESVNPV